MSFGSYFKGAGEAPRVSSVVQWKGGALQPLSERTPHTSRRRQNSPPLWYPLTSSRGAAETHTHTHSCTPPFTLSWDPLQPLGSDHRSLHVSSCAAGFVHVGYAERPAVEFIIPCRTFLRTYPNMRNSQRCNRLLFWGWSV